jgi:hypothetical protein
VKNYGLSIVCRFDSSRFSGQLSKHDKACPGATLQITFRACKEHILSGALNIVIASQVWARGIAKKDIPLFLKMHCFSAKGNTAKKDIPMPIHQVSGNFKELTCYYISDYRSIFR